MNNLQGTGVAVVTPFKRNLEIDFNPLGKIIDHLLEGKVEYLVMLGTTGESATLSGEEKQEIFEFAAKRTDGKVNLVAGYGGNNTSELLAGLKKLELEGYSALLSVSPYYNKPSQSGIIKHYTQLADASRLPIILYNVPGRTGSNLRAETTLQLAEHENIIAVKEASGNFDQVMEIIRNKPDNFEVISGDDAYTLPFIACGMTGVISVIANAYPYVMSEMVRKAIYNDFDAAREFQYKLLPLIDMAFREGSPSGIKQMLSEKNLSETYIRPPLDDISDELKELIKDSMF